ncbi:MAG: CpsD/CapB family tyrosine-protein kinase [Defluviimonas sp.]|nr:CpsD/CapB family tyrosine-protein kinase [Defluviimonas sp.]
MEKLQAALDKARSERGLATQASAAVAAGRPGTVRGARDADQMAGQTGPAGPMQAGAPATDAIRAAWAALGELAPDRAHFARRRLVALDQAPPAAPFDMLRTRVRQMMGMNGWRRLAITSPDQGCGKTTLSINLALSFARQVELRTILYDCDLRRPTLARTLGLPRDRSRGMAELLLGEASFAETALRIGPSLATVSAVSTFPGSAELLQSQSAAESLARIEADYAPEIEIFDLPPLLACDDTMGFLGRVDCALLVVEADVTSLEAIDRCERELAERTHVLGVVINKNRFEESSDRKSYYY